MAVNKNKLVASAFASACALALVACGGGGGSSSGDSGGNGGGGGVQQNIASLSGTVVDGYIRGATVFLDLNNNQTQDSNEPSATTQAGGAYTLNTASLDAAQVKAAHLITVVPDTALDEDDGGKTLKEAQKKGFTLMAPVAAYAIAADGNISAAVVSPVTTLVSHAMVSDGAMTVAQATTSAQAALGLDSSTSLTQDVSKNSTLHQKSRTIAAALGQVQDTVQTTSSTSATNQRDTLFAALAYVRKNFALLEQAVDSSPSGTSIADAVKAATASSGVAPVDAASLVATAQQTTNTTASNWSAALAEGAYFSYCVLEKDKTYSACIPSYSKMGLGQAANTFQEVVFYFLKGVWGTDSTNSSRCMLTSKGCVSYAMNSGGYTADGNAATLGEGDAWRLRATLRSLDIGGKKWTEVAALPASTTFADLVFPAGAKIHYTTLTRLLNEYRLNGDTSYVTGNSGANFTSLEAFVNGKQTSTSTGKLDLAEPYDMRFTFNEDFATANSQNGGTLTVYRCSDGSTNSSVCYGNGAVWTPSGKGRYVFETVYGQKILRILTPYVNSSSFSGTQRFYVVSQGAGTSAPVVWGGQYMPSYVPSSSMAFNKTAFSAILKAGSLPELVN